MSGCGMGHHGTSIQQETMPGHVQSGLFLHRSKGWVCGWGLAGQGEKATEGASEHAGHLLQVDGYNLPICEW